MTCFFGGIGAGLFFPVGGGDAAATTRAAFATVGAVGGGVGTFAGGGVGVGDSGGATDSSGAKDAFLTARAVTGATARISGYFASS